MVIRGILLWLGSLAEDVIVLVDPEIAMQVLSENEADEEEEVLVPDPRYAPNMNDYIHPSSVESEMAIRQVLELNMKQEAKAKDLVIGMMGLSRSLGTMAHITVHSAGDRRICSEAMNTVYIASQCEMMMRSLTGLQFIQSYSFLNQGPSDGQEQAPT
jgi:hypothetical protein